MKPEYQPERPLRSHKSPIINTAGLTQCQLPQQGPLWPNPRWPKPTFSKRFCCKMFTKHAIGVYGHGTEISCCLGAVTTLSHATALQLHLLAG